ncbi:MAG: hypothetical protein GC149_10860 [Gammaproteobacteria bacterium]|nr:hypothetical protein [Gammaproteobacteria bacterium]
MAKLFVEQEATAQWHDLVKEAEAFNGVHLDEELESYLVFLLMRYTGRPELAAKVMALDYLHGAQTAGSERREKMRDVGDQCLLFSGLFPKRAEKRRVRVSYYVDLGRTAYHNVAEAAQAAMAEMFHHLSDSFVSLMDTLQAMRSMHARDQQLDPLHALDLLQDTGSQRARTILGQTTQAIPLVIPSRTRH